MGNVTVNGQGSDVSGTPRSTSSPLQTEQLNCVLLGNYHDATIFPQPFVTFTSTLMERELPAKPHGRVWTDTKRNYEFGIIFHLSRNAPSPANSRPKSTGLSNQDANTYLPCLNVTWYNQHLPRADQSRSGSEILAKACHACTHSQRG